jgi:hypothetical protein
MQRFSSGVSFGGFGSNPEGAEQEIYYSTLEKSNPETLADRAGARI